MTFTADLCDQYPQAQVLELSMRHFGARMVFEGPISTLKVFEDNQLVGEALRESGAGRVLVVDGGGSLRRALVGDNLARRAAENAWGGIVVYGCIRDAAQIADIDVGIKALGTHPRRTEKRGEGRREITVGFGGVTFRPGDRLYADADGIVVLAAADVDETT